MRFSAGTAENFVNSLLGKGLLAIFANDEVLNFGAVQFTARWSVF
ncbi:hypothetical protein [Photorhabdus temperata]|nr:hypothetical protein [Photorhabdus temperata]